MTQEHVPVQGGSTGRTGYRVVVGTDGSLGSRLAVRWAATLAGPGAQLTVLRAWERSLVVAKPLRSPTELDRQVELGRVIADVEAEVQGLQRVLGPGGAQANTAVVSGRATSVLDDISHRADVVVVGSRGRGAVSGGLFGSVSRHVVTHAACPVVVVPARAVQVVAPMGTRTSEVVVAVDGSARDVGAARWAAHEARRLGARLTLVHTFTVLGVPSPAGPIRTSEQRRIDERAASAVLRRTQQLVEHELGPGPPVSTELIEGPVADALVTRSAGVLLLVLAAHRARLVHHRLGTVAGVCMRRAACPVAVVPADAVIVDRTMAAAPARAVLRRQPRLAAATPSLPLP